MTCDEQASHSEACAPGNSAPQPPRQSNGNTATTAAAQADPHSNAEGYKGGLACGSEGRSARSRGEHWARQPTAGQRRGQFRTDVRHSALPTLLSAHLLGLCDLIFCWLLDPPAVVSFAAAMSSAVGPSSQAALLSSAAVSAPHAHAVSYLHCPLCLDPFHATQSKLQPRLLPACAHTLCTRCLQQQWALQAAERLHPTFLCPLDSAPVRVTQVDDIPLNKILLGLLAVMQSSDQSERDFKVGVYATPKCVEEDCSNEAVWHCFNDDADMCEEHKASSHDGLRSNITKSHRLVRLEEKVSPLQPTHTRPTRSHSAKQAANMDARAATLPLLVAPTRDQQRRPSKIAANVWMPKGQRDGGTARMRHISILLTRSRCFVSSLVFLSFALRTRTS